MKNIFILLLIACGTAVAKEQQIPSSSQPLVIDGVMDEAIWKNALPIDIGFEVEPATNIKAKVKTTAYVVDTGSSIAFAFKAEDPSTQKIRAFLGERDNISEEDYVGILIDSYNDERRALGFFVNPLGVQLDLIRDFNDVPKSNKAWDAVWESAAKITDTGYVAEFVIPYSELQMPNSNGKKTLGMLFIRNYPRESTFSLQNTANDRNNNCFLCVIDKYTGLENATRGLDLEITPSVTMIKNQQRENLSQNYSSAESSYEPSLDVNWGINSNLTLNATINPDFSQVEEDDAQLNVNQAFSLFYPEKRSFFLENADFFNTRLKLVHTRNISNPDYGLRLVGKIDENAYGIFYTNDETTNLLLPGVLGSDIVNLNLESENLVARYRRDIGDSSTIGAMLTSRKADGYANDLVAIDTNYRLTNEDTILFQYASSSTQNPNQLTNDYSLEDKSHGNAMYFRYFHQDESWYYHFTQRIYDDGFRSDLGFEDQVSYDQTIIGTSYTWRSDANRWWNSIDLYGDWDITHDQQGNVIENEKQIDLVITAVQQSKLELNLLNRQKFWGDRLFDESIFGLKGSFSPMQGVILGAGFKIGDAIDYANIKLAKRNHLFVNTQLNLGRHFKIAVKHSFTQLERDGGNVFNANQTDLRLSYQFDLRHRLRLAVINTSIHRDTSLYSDAVNSYDNNLQTQLVYSYKVNPRTLLYFGYSDSSHQDESIDLTRENRSLFAKFSYAFKY